MSLTHCIDCGREVSNRAAACPWCGGPMHPPTGSDPVTRGGRAYPRSMVREAKLLAAGNLGGVMGLLMWLMLRHDGREAQGLTLAKYTANFATYRDHLAEQAKMPLAAMVIACILMALVGAGLYEVVLKLMLRILGRNLPAAEPAAHPGP